MSNDLNVIINLLANSKGLEAGYKNAVVQQVALNRELNRGNVAAVNAGRGINRLEQQADGLGRTMQSVGRYAGAAFGIFAAQRAALGIKNVLADYQDFETRLRFLSGTTEVFTENLSFLDKLSAEHGKSILDLGNGYASVTALVRGGTISMQEGQAITVGLSNAQSALGASTGQLGLVMYGLGQALSQPKVQAQEFNQVTEPLPGLMQELTKAAGLTTGSYRDLVLAGELTSEQFSKDLVKALESYDGAAKANINNIRAQENALINMRAKAVKAFEEPIKNIYGELLGTTGDGLKLLADNAGTVTTALEYLIVAGLIKGTSALSGITAAQIKKVATDKAEALSALQTARAEQAKAAILQRATAEQFRNAVSIKSRTAFMYQASAASTAFAIATNNLTAAQARYNVVGSAGILIGRGLTAAIGGLPGLLALGAYALYDYATSQDTAANSTKTLADETERLNAALNPFINYTKTQATGALLRYTGQLKLAGQIAEETAQRFNNPFFKTTISDVNAANAEVERLTKIVGALQAVLNKKTDSVVVAPVDKDVLKDAEKLLASLERQKALYGDTSEAAKIRYDLEKGALKDIDQALKDKIILVAQDIDNQERVADAAKTLKQESERYLSSLQQQKARLDETSEVAKLRYELEHGALININAELRDKLLLEAKELDNLEKNKKLRADVERIAAAAQTPRQREDNLFKSNIGTLEAARDGLPETELTQRQSINQLIEAEQRRHAEALSQITQKSNNEFDALWSESFDRFASGIGNATANALFESESLGDGLRNIAGSIGKQMVATLVEIGVKRLALAAINAGAATTEAAVATTASVSSAAAITTAMTPAAAATSLATAGSNGIGSIAAIAAVGAAMAAMFAGFFDKGGNIGRGQFGIVGEYGPEIVKGPANITSRADTAKILNRSSSSAANRGGDVLQITVNDNKVINTSGSSDEQLTQMQRAMAENNQILAAQIARDIRRGQGDIYSAIKRAS